MTPKESNLARQHAFRNRRLALGLDEVRGIWLPKELHRQLKDYAEQLKKDHADERNCV
jgi:hypothetical protein